MVFDIELEPSAVAAAIDGRFRSGPLQGRTAADGDDIRGGSGARLAAGAGAAVALAMAVAMLLRAGQDWPESQGYRAVSWPA